MHLAASGVNVVHPMTLLAKALAAEDGNS
jgi:hypothetical protein